MKMNNPNGNRESRRRHRSSTSRNQGTNDHNNQRHNNNSPVSRGESGSRRHQGYNQGSQVRVF